MKNHGVTDEGKQLAFIKIEVFAKENFFKSRMQLTTF